MHHFHKLSVVTVSLLIFVSPTQAQSVATLKESIEWAILTNPEIKNLSVNNVYVQLDLSECHDRCCQVVERQEAAVKLLVSNQ